MKHWGSNTLNNWNEIEKPHYIITWKDNQRMALKGYRDIYLGNYFKLKKKTDYGL
jgi:hypothetical protein